MRISQMQAIVDRADSTMREANHRLDSLFTDHIGYITAREDSTLQTDETITEREAIGRAMTFLTTTRSKLEGESYKRNAEHETSNKYAVEIYKKYAIPFACFLFVFVGAPLGILTKGGNFGMSSAISLGCYVLYWIALIGGEKLADRGFLEPSLAMWMGNIIFMGVGLFTTLRVNAR